MAIETAWLTPAEVAERYRVSRRTLERLVKKRGFPLPYKVGRLSRFNLAEIKAWEEKSLPKASC